MARLTFSQRSQAVPKIELRLTGLSLLVACLMALVSVRLYYLQVVKHPQMAELADRNRIRLLRTPPLRGLVYDRNHKMLVDTQPTFDAVMVPEDARDLSGTIEKLEKHLGQDHLADKLEEAQDEGRPPFDPVTVDQELSWEQVVAIETHQLELPGVSLQVTPRRHYIYGTLAAHLLGYVGEVTERDLTKLPGYHGGDEIGKFGLERVLEGPLRGDAGGQEVEVDAVGRRLRLLREIPEKPGDSVVLTIDLDLQRTAEQAIGSRAGALIALDANTGQILAMASHPAFDPNIFAHGITAAQWRNLTGDPGHPLENRVIQGVYPPGSTFKVVDTIAGMEERTLNEHTTYNCSGSIFYGDREYRCWRAQGHGDVPLHRAIVESCDVFFYNVGEHLGIDRLARWATALGIGVKSGIDLENERTGVMPSSKWKRARFAQQWYPAETLSVAIGQGYVAVTPLQMAQVAAEVANGGIRYKPQFVKQVEALDGTVVKSFAPIIEARVRLDPTVLDVLRSAMCDVVATIHGTAHAARLDNVEMCGKTGTAQVIKQKQGARIKEEELTAETRDHGWFMAYAPRDHPQIAIACIIEHAGHGGSSAAPVVHDVLQKYFQLHPPPAPPPGAKPAIEQARAKNSGQAADQDESDTDSGPDDSGADTGDNGRD